MDPRYIESGATTYVSPLAGEQNVRVKDGAGKLLRCRVFNTTAAKIYVMIGSGVAGADLIMPPIPVPANDSVELSADLPVTFASQLRFAASTTQTVYGAAGANAMHVLAVYK